MPRTNQVKKKEEENVSHNERVHVERPGNGGSRVLLSNWKRVCCTDLHKTERGMGWAGGETSARTRGANKPHQSFQVILEMMRRKLLKYLTRKESFIFEWHHQAKTKLRFPVSRFPRNLGQNILSFAWKETKIHKVLCHSLTEMLHQQSRAQGLLSPVCIHSITYLKEKQLLEAEE